MAEADATTSERRSTRAGARRALGSLATSTPSPDDPRIEADLAAAAASARRASPPRTAGRVASSPPAPSPPPSTSYEALQEPVARAGAYAGLLFAADTSVPRHGALLQRVQERGSAIRSELLFFELEWVALPDARAEALLADSGARAPPPPARRAAPLPAAPAQRARGAASSRRRRTPGAAPSARLFDEVLADARFRVERRRQARSRSARRRRSRCSTSPTARCAARRGAGAHRRACASARACSASSSTRWSRTRRCEDRLRSYADPMDDAQPRQRDRRRRGARAARRPARRATRWCSATTA